MWNLYDGDVIVDRRTWLFGRFMFFFFKQKTAYELRISDWSSDVCSSDLGASSNSTRSKMPSRTGAGQTRDSIRPSQSHQVPLRAGLRAREREIGRESCRDRVCQSV